MQVRMSLSTLRSAPLLQPALGGGARLFSKSASQREQDHYAVLGVRADSPQAHIKKMFYQLSKRYHPDAPSSAGEPAEQRLKKFHAINDAYHTLSDDVLRRQYDRRTPHGPSRTHGRMRTQRSSNLYSAHPGPAWSATASANDERREKANYAWSHPAHRRTGPSAAEQGHSRVDPFASRRGAAAERAESHFDTFAARELRTRLRQAANSRPSAMSAFGEKAEEEARLINDSGFKRTGTVVLLFGAAMALAGLMRSERKPDTKPKR